ncbi:hypothetical protein [Occallatibacter savannae]|uniref:hypothetical protein n=1 Tax=Occallatibacter savannae TaxID=1002691 RepID=UPI000D687D96|nr:hypothetical protein [Occallatibacter savannae]
MQIEFLSDVNEIDPDNDNIDVSVTLDDGHVYTFLLATPNNIYRCMENEGVGYFFGSPAIFVRRLTLSNVREAIEAVVKEPKWLEIYGR